MQLWRALLAAGHRCLADAAAQLGISSAPLADFLGPAHLPKPACAARSRGHSYQRKHVMQVALPACLLSEPCKEASTPTVQRVHHAANETAHSRPQYSHKPPQL